MCDRLKKDERLKLIYEKSIEMHRFLLGWRDKLLAGYVAVLGALIYFLVNHDNYVIHSCIAGIIITIIILFLSVRNTVLYWKCSNTAYCCEKVLVDDFEFEGLYSVLTSNKIKRNVDIIIGNVNHKTLTDKLYSPIPASAYTLDIRNHTGAINWIYFLSLLGFLALLDYKFDWYVIRNIFYYLSFCCR